MRIFAGVPWREASNDSGVIENVDFYRFWTLRLRQLRKWGQHYHIILFSPLSPFHWPQNAWHWITLNGHFKWNSIFVQVCLDFLHGFCGNNCVENNKGRSTLSAAKIFSMNSSFWGRFMRHSRWFWRFMCKFSFAFVHINYTGMVCRTSCQDHVVLVVELQLRKLMWTFALD